MSAVSHTTMKITANLAYNHGSSKKDDPTAKHKVIDSTLFNTVWMCVD